MAYGWRGHIQRTPDGVEGVLRDGLGFSIVLSGTPAHLVGTPGAMPAWFALIGDEECQPEWEPWP